ncbi:hypothetical protein DUNSADRAFT_11983 [Dunaliella salina]|uniref:Trafficking protein particle complex subunit 11 domain-containing protein n=1 Tax=Dunaliella salina TaxID=3046 RepID=A0ABQ7GC56_DUNSA|nr:hypothetical protein DUNSADRAFT_11983 [Dunaliella salina]|eukprot:KAF5832199.1 hypothetical protein DUNSADRAFT_11983 [Dunaliella salina]
MHDDTRMPPYFLVQADWFAKHRSKRAAAALALINRDELLGDFTSWNAMLQRLQDIQHKVVRRGAEMLVAVLQTYEEGELPADCVASLCKSLNISTKLVCTLPVCMIGTHELSRSAEAVAALKALGALAHEQCSAYYLRRVQHVTAKLARRAAAVDADAYLQLSARAATKILTDFVKRKIGSSLSGSSSFSGLSSLATSRQNSSSNVASSAAGQGAAAAGMPGRPVISGLGAGGHAGGGPAGGGLGGGGLGASMPGRPIGGHSVIASTTQAVGAPPVGMRGLPSQAPPSSPMVAGAQGLPGDRPQPVSASAGASARVVPTHGGEGGGGVMAGGSVFGSAGRGVMQSGRAGGMPGAGSMVGGGSGAVRGVSGVLHTQTQGAAGGQQQQQQQQQQLHSSGYPGYPGLGAVGGAAGSAGGGAASVQGLASSMAAQLAAAASTAAAAATTRVPGASPAAAGAPPSSPSVAPLSRPTPTAPPVPYGASSGGAAGRVDAPPLFAAPPRVSASAQSPDTTTPRPTLGTAAQGWAFGAGAAPPQQPSASSPGVRLQTHHPSQGTSPPRFTSGPSYPSLQGFPQTTAPPMPPPPPPPPPPAPSPPPPPVPETTPTPVQQPAQQQRQHQPPYPHPYSTSIPPSDASTAHLQPAVPSLVSQSQSIPAPHMPFQTMPAPSLLSQTTSPPGIPTLGTRPTQTVPHPSAPAQHMFPQTMPPPSRPPQNMPPPSMPSQNMPSLRQSQYPTPLHHSQQQQQYAHTGSFPGGGPSYPQAYPFVPQQRQQQPLPHATQVPSSSLQPHIQHYMPHAHSPANPGTVGPMLTTPRSVAAGVAAAPGTTVVTPQPHPQGPLHAASRSAAAGAAAAEAAPGTAAAPPQPQPQPQGPMHTAQRGAAAGAAAASAPGTTAATPQPLPQPGMIITGNQSWSAQPGSAQSGSVQPRPAQPRSTAPGMKPGPRLHASPPPGIKPGSAHPGSVQSGAAQPRPAQPGSTSPGIPTAAPGSAVASAPSPQMYVQAARLAELLQLKLLMLLTVQERLDEAAAQAATHISLFAAPPGVLGAALDALQLSFLSRQLRVVAEVVSPKFEAQPSSTWNSIAKGCSRSLLLLSAAQAAVAHRRAVDTLAASGSAAASFDTFSVRPGQHLGQAVMTMTDAEFVAWLEDVLRSPSGRGSNDAHPKSPDLQAVASSVLGGGPKAVNGTSAAFEALEAAASTYKHRDMKAPRERALLCLLAGEELLAAGDLQAAHTHLLAAAHTYRREGWPELLLHTLLLLVECAQHSGLPTEAALYTLEAASLQPGLPSAAAPALGSHQKPSEAIGSHQKPSEAAPASGSNPALPPDTMPQGSSTAPTPSATLSKAGSGPRPTAARSNSAAGGAGGGGAAAAAVPHSSGGLHAATAALPVSLEHCHAAAAALLPPASGRAAQHAQHAQRGAARGPDSNMSAAGSAEGGEDACDVLKGRVFNVENFDLEAREWFKGPGLGGAKGAPESAPQPGWVQPHPSQQEAGANFAAAAAGSDSVGAGLLSPDVRLALEAHHQKDFGWWRILAVSVGWAANTPSDTEAADCYVAVRSCLPKGAPSLPISGITLTLRDEDGEWQVPTTTALPLVPSIQKDHKANEQQQQQQQQKQPRRCKQKEGQDEACVGLWPAADALDPSGRWIHAMATVAPRRLGHLEVTQVSLHLGPLHTADIAPSTPSAHATPSTQAPHEPAVPPATEAAGKSVAPPTPPSTIKGAAATVNFSLAPFPRPPPGPSSCLSTHSTLGGLLERFAGVVAPPPASPPSPPKPSAGAHSQGSLLFPRPVPAPFKGLPAVDVRGGGGGGGATIAVTHLGRLPTLKLAPMPAACKPSCCFLGEPC